MSTAVSVTAADIMIRGPVTTDPRASLREALDLMIEHHVSGLPVLDQEDRCIGVVSASDILTVESEHAALEHESLGAYFDADTQSWESVRIAPDDERLADIDVQYVMSSELISAAPDAPISAVAKLMINHEVHRVMVVDENRRLLGIVSALDFVRVAAQ